MFFRGYVKTNGKVATEKFKNVPLRSLEEVQNLESYAGILADDAILIDVDDFEQSEILMRIVEEKEIFCRVYKTTRGKHFFFRNSKIKKCYTGVRLACGLTADIKCGKTNSYSILKKNGEEREIIYDILDGEKYQELPSWLFPVKSKVNFESMEQGDGRNQSLFNYILTLQSSGFSKDDVRETLHVINDYILKEPLSENELLTLSRDDAFLKETFYNGKTFLFDKFAKFLKSEYRIIRIDNQLHMYEDGVYKGGYSTIEAKMIKHIPGLNKSKRSEVMAYLELLCDTEKEMSDAEYIVFRNGVYNIATGELRPFDPELVILNKIDWNYNPDAYNVDVDTTLDRLSCNDRKVRALLEEAIGYCFYRRNELRKAFILTGEKQNGKSTYLSLISSLLGKDNVTSLDLAELGQRFKPAELFGKLANVGDDIGDDFISNPAIFKKVVSGDPVNVERKGENPFDLKNYSKFLFSANSIPRIKDKSGAVISRLVIIPFNARFTKDDPAYDPYIKYKLRTESAMEYLIQLGIKGLKRVLHNYSFTESESVQRALAEYEEDNNPILLFFKEVEKSDIVNRSTRDIYSRYGLFCAENNFSPMSNIQFSKQVKQRYDLEIADRKVGGKKYRVFVERKKS
jgi:putative DNA primase/helicase|nr:MAG TPA: dsDNA helicase [Caudoviricetes sp.]